MARLTSACAAAAVLAAVSLASACSPQSATPGADMRAATAPDDLGARLYSQNCVPCHREDGAGVPTVYPPLAASSVARGDPVQLAQWVLSGKRPPTMPAGRYSTQMLQFGWLKDRDAAALLTYVRSHFGNDASPVDAAMVAKAR